MQAVLLAGFARLTQQHIERILTCTTKKVLNNINKYKLVEFSAYLGYQQEHQNQFQRGLSVQ